MRNDSRSRGEQRHYHSKRELYRDPDNGKICGVCAGIADYFGFETWVVRVIAVSLLIFLNGGMVLGYFIACWLLEVKPGSKSRRSCYPHFRSRQSREENTYQEQKEPPRYRPNVQEVWKKGNVASQTIDSVQKKFNRVEGKLRNLESYITSKKFKLDQEFASMEKDK